MLNLRLARFEHLVDIGRVAELRGIERRERARHDRCGDPRRGHRARPDRSPPTCRCWPRRRRTSATSRSATGARSAGRWPTPIRRPSTRPWPSPSTPRSELASTPAAPAPSPAADFFTGVWSTALEADELLTAIDVPGVDRTHRRRRRRVRPPPRRLRHRRRRRRRGARRRPRRPARRSPCSAPPARRCGPPPPSRPSPGSRSARVDDRRARRAGVRRHRRRRRRPAGAGAPTAGGSGWRWSPRRGSGRWPRPRTEHDMAEPVSGGADGERLAAADGRRGPQDAGRRAARGPRPDRHPPRLRARRVRRVHRPARRRGRARPA